MYVKKQKKKKRAEQVTYAVRDQRVNQVIEMVIMGYRRKEVIEHCSKEWSTSLRAVDRYWTKAVEFLRKTADVDRIMELGRAVERYNQIYGRAYAINELRTALAANTELSKLLGLGEVSSMTFKINGQVEHAISGDTAQTVFDILTKAGVFVSGVDAPEAE